MGLDVIFDDFFIQVLSGLIVASIIGLSSLIIVLIRCVHKQAADIALMKKATIIVLNMIAKDTSRLHGADANLTEFDKLYKELISDND